MSISRRTVIAGAAAVGVAGAVSACGSSSASESGSSAPATSTPAESSAATSAGGGGATLTTTSAVPVGGGVIVESGGKPYAVTQAEKGKFACFSAICPHQGCACNEITDGVIVCPCHGSTFSVATGDRVSGPATSGLPPAAIAVSGDSITLA